MDAETKPILNLLTHGIDGLLAAPGASVLEELLTSYLPQQRWFGAKSRTIKTVTVLNSAPLSGLNAVLAFLQITYEDDSQDIYHLP